MVVPFLDCDELPPSAFPAGAGLSAFLDGVTVDEASEHCVLEVLLLPWRRAGENDADFFATPRLAETLGDVGVLDVLR